MVSWIEIKSKNRLGVPQFYHFQLLVSVTTREVQCLSGVHILIFLKEDLANLTSIVEAHMTFT